MSYCLNASLNIVGPGHIVMAGCQSKYSHMERKMKIEILDAPSSPAKNTSFVSKKLVKPF